MKNTANKEMKRINRTDNHIKGTSQAYQEQMILDMLGERNPIQPQEAPMKLYAATDLHSSNNYLAIIDENGERRFKQKLPNNPALILEALMPYKKEIAGIVVESTYNWYWLVDMLMAKGDLSRNCRITLLLSLKRLCRTKKKLPA